MFQNQLQQNRSKREMGYRHDKRVIVPIDIYIYCHGLPVAVGVTRDISAGGAFVNTSFLPDSEHQIVDIEFVASDRDRTEVYRVKAMVVHNRSDGIGFMIDDFNPESKLPKLLLHPQNLTQRCTT